MRNSSELMGTLAWADKTGGNLSSLEKAKLLRNIVMVKARDAFDVMRSRLGLLHTNEVDLDKLSPPDSALVKDAEAFAIRTHNPSLLFHSYRTYYFGALIAAHDNTAYDPELLFAAAILHDTALTDSRNTALDQCCFAVSGGRQVRSMLLEKQHPEAKIDCIANAISLHLNLYVPEYKHGAIAALTARGAICDVFAAGHKRIGIDTLRRVLVKYPRTDLYKSLSANGAPHARNSRPYFLTKLTGGLPQSNPLDSI